MMPNNQTNGFSAGNTQFGSVTRQGFGNADNTGMAQLMGISFGQTGYSVPKSLTNATLQSKQQPSVFQGTNSGSVFGAFSQATNNNVSRSDNGGGFVFGSSQQPNQSEKSPFALVAQTVNQGGDFSVNFSNLSGNNQSSTPTGFQNVHSAFQTPQRNSNHGDWLTQGNTDSSKSLSLLKPIFGDFASSPTPAFGTAVNRQTSYTNNNNNKTMSDFSLNMPMPGLFSTTNATAQPSSSSFSNSNSSNPHANPTASVTTAQQQNMSESDSIFNNGSNFNTSFWKQPILELSGHEQQYSSHTFAQKPHTMSSPLPLQTSQQTSQPQNIPNQSTRSDNIELELTSQEKDIPVIFLEAFNAPQFIFQKIPYIPPPAHLI